MCPDGTSFFFWGNLTNLITFSLVIFPYLLIGFKVYQTRKKVQPFNAAQLQNNNNNNNLNVMTYKKELKLSMQVFFLEFSQLKPGKIKISIFCEIFRHVL